MSNRAPAKSSPVKLKCDAFENPIGIGNTQPTLSWQLPANAAVEKVTAYEIEAAASAAALKRGEADLWRSGKVDAAWASNARYAGESLGSRDSVFWRVRVWGEGAEPGAWSTAASFQIGLLSEKDWEAKWIATPVLGSRRTRAAAPHLRKGFALPGKVKQARLHITARGLFVCEINGERVSEDELAPGWTDYAKRIPVRAYDVTKLLLQGDNAMGVTLGDGWYCGRIGWLDRQYYGERPSLLAQLEVEYADGSTEVIATDASWQWKTGAILENDMITGESVDARLDLGDWSAADFDASAWPRCELESDPQGKVEPATGPAVRAQERLSPISRIPADSGVPGPEKEAEVFDFGQNFSGRISVRLKGKRGTVVRFRYAEMMEAPDRVYVENLRSAEATDYYTMRGDAEGESWETLFTFHGFRFVEVTYDIGTASVEAIEAVVLHSQLPLTGSFSCSHPLVNQLQHNILWGQKSNFLEVPTDCPQRDERLGWTGDAQMFARTAAFNSDVQSFFRKWSIDLRDAQGEDGYIPRVIPSVMEGWEDAGPAWSDAQVICPWVMYLSYGDVDILRDHYVSMDRYVQQLIDKCSKDYIRCHPDLDIFRGYGDWLALDGSSDRFGNTPKELIGTAYMAYDLGIMAKVARVLGKAKDSKRYEAAREKCVAAFNDRFVTPDGQVLGGTQTSYVLALHFDLLPEEKRPAAVESLVRDIEGRDFHLSTGFVGTPYICHVLSRFGRTDVAYRLLEQESFPSWLLPVRNGATTMWERWNSWTPEDGFGDVSMNSFNHYAYGAVGDWLYSTVAGLDFDEDAAGYQAVRFRPEPGGTITRAETALDSPRGKIAIKWTLGKKGLSIALTVPCNVEATLELPESWKADKANGLGKAEACPRGQVWQVGPGKHKLSFR